MGADKSTDMKGTGDGCRRVSLVASFVNPVLNTIERGMVWASPKLKRNLFLEGPYAPVEESGPWKELPVKGLLPVAINGEFVRNGPNPKFPPTRNYHWFDGDGMLHGVRIKDGKATFVSRLVRTSRLEQETVYKRAMFPKLGDLSGYYALGALLINKLRKTFGVISEKNGAGTGNTALIYHDGRLLALHEGDKPYAIRVLEDGEMETVGRYSYGEKLQHAFTAHPKVDSKTGEMFFFGYNMEKQPYVTYRKVSADGKIGDPVNITVRKPIMMHDFAITERYAIFLDLPLLFSPKDVVKTGSAFFFDKSMPSRFGILPRDADNEAAMRWFELPPCSIFHTVNAWEEGEEVVLHACRTDDMDLGMLMSAWKDDPPQPNMTEFRFNMATGKATQKRLVDFPTDFPRINESFVGRKQRYTYASKFANNMSYIEGVVKVDLWAEPSLGSGNPEPGTGAVVGYFPHGSGRGGSEPVFVPSGGDNSAEDDGYLLSFVYDQRTDKSEIVVTDAKTMSLDPVAVIQLPVRVPYGFHGIFVSEAQLQTQKTTL